MIKKNLILIICATISTVHAAEKDSFSPHSLDMKKIVQLVSSSRIGKEYLRQTLAQQDKWGTGVTKKIDGIQNGQKFNELKWEITTYNPSNLFVSTEHDTKIQINEIAKYKIFNNKKIPDTNFQLKTNSAIYVYCSDGDTCHCYPPSPR